MADTDGMPPWVSYLSDQITESRKETNENLASFRRDVAEQLGKLLPRDSFVAEQRRVNEKFESGNTRMGKLEADLAAEATARVTAEKKAQDERLAEEKERTKIGSQTRWQWVLIIGGLIATKVADVIWPTGGTIGGP